MGEEITKSFIESEVKKVTGLEPGERDYDLACVMLAATAVGISIKRISTLLKRSRAEVGPLVKKCRETGIFVGRKIHHSGWFDEESGGIAFNLDVAVAMGWLART